MADVKVLKNLFCYLMLFSLEAFLNSTNLFRYLRHFYRVVDAHYSSKNYKFEEEITPVGELH